MNNTYTADFESLVTRYGGFLFGIIYMFFYLTLRTLTDNKIDSSGFISLIFSDYRGVLIILGILTFGHINLYLAGHNYTKRLIISDSSVTFYLFNFFKYKIVELKYSDIDLVENDKHPTIFTFILKSGNKTEIHATVKNRNQALELI